MKTAIINYNKNQNMLYELLRIFEKISLKLGNKCNNKQL